MSDDIINRKEPGKQISMYLQAHSKFILYKKDARNFIWYCLFRLLNSNLGYGESRAPLLLQNIQANATIAIDIWVKDLCPECNLHSIQNNDKTMSRTKTT